MSNWFYLSVLLTILGVACFQFDVAAGETNKNKAKPKPRPAPPPPVFQGDSISQFAVQAQDEEDDEGFEVIGACREYSADPCKCSARDKCEFNEITGKCVSQSANFAEKLTCRRAGAIYAFGTNISCPQALAQGECNKGMSVYAVNLNGIPHYYEEKHFFKPEKGALKVDKLKLNKGVKSTCKVSGAVSKADAERVYGTFVEGDPAKRDEGSCVSYPVPLLQDGQYELTIKTVSGAERCMDIKFSGATVAENLNLMKLAGNEDCKAVDITVLFLVANKAKLLHIKGHQTSVPINRGFSLKLCYAACEEVPGSTYRASAFQLTRFGSDSMSFEDLEMNVKTNADGSFSITSINMKVATIKNVQIQYEQQVLQPNKRAKVQTQTKAKVEETVQKIMRDKQEKIESQNEKCPAIADKIACKKAECEFNLVRGTCESAENACAGSILGAVTCFRANSYYISGGVACKTTTQQEGECKLGEVKFAVNLFGERYRDVNGIDYSSGLNEMSKAGFGQNAEQINLVTSKDTKCKKDANSPLEISGGAGDGVKLYDTVVRGKASTKEDLTFTIDNVGEGSYELGIKTIEPFHGEKGKRVFNIKINGEVVVSNLDIAAYAGVCVGIDLIIQLQIINELVIITGFDGKEIPITDGKLLVSFAYGDPAMGYEDTAYILSAMYLARLRVKGEEEKEVQIEDVAVVNLAGELYQSDSAKNEKGGKIRGGSGGAGAVSGADLVKAVQSSDGIKITSAASIGGVKIVSSGGAVPGMFGAETEAEAAAVEGTAISGTAGVNMERETGADGAGISGSAGVGAEREAGAEGDSMSDAIGVGMEGETGAQGEGISGGAGADLGDEADTEGEGISASAGADTQGDNGSDGGGMSGAAGAKEESKGGPEGGGISGTAGVKEGSKGGPEGGGISGTAGVKEGSKGGPEGGGISGAAGVNEKGTAGPNGQGKAGEASTRVDGKDSEHGDTSIAGVGIDAEIEAGPHGSGASGGAAVADPGAKPGQAPSISIAIAGAEAESAVVSGSILGDGKPLSIKKIVLAAAAKSCKECTAFSSDPKGCLAAGFQYNIIDEHCVNMTSGCSKILEKTKDICRRSSVTYVSGGLPCFNNIDAGDCGSPTLIHGLNLGSTAFKDERGIEYKAEESFAIDPEGIRTVEDLNEKCPTFEGVSKTDAEGIFSKVILGKADSAAGACIKYDVAICQEGFYQLTIKLADTVAINERCFDIRIDDTPIMIGVDITKLAGGKTCHPVELAFPIQIENQGGSETQTLKIEGHDNLIFIEKHFQLQFCNCEWESPNPTFHLNAFSLVRFGEGTIPCDACNVYKDDQEGCVAIGCDFNEAKKTCIHKVVEVEAVAISGEALCNSHEGNANACKLQGCEYNLVTAKCEPGLSTGGGKCKDKDFEQFPEGCRRSNAYYSIEGSLCLNEGADSAGCATGETIWALNLNGDNYTSERGIVYMAEDPLFVNDPLELKMQANAARYCPDSDVEFQKVYSPGIKGSPNKEQDNPEGCLDYGIPVAQDGIYELSVLFVDGQYHEPNKRCFDIKINSVTMAYSVDPARMASKGAESTPENESSIKCAKNELIILFKVANGGTELTPHMYEAPILIDGTAQLSFCYGKCGYADPIFQISAFSIVRYGGGANPVDICTVLNANRFACEKYDCEYIETEKKCHRSEMAEKCHEFSNDPCLCAQNKCRYDAKRERCVVQDEAFVGKLTCRRPSSHYAFSSKDICKFGEDVPTGACNMGTTVFGVNLHGMDYIDSEGIKYKADTAALRLDPNDIRKTNIIEIAGLNIPGVSENDVKMLYASSMIGAAGKMNTGSCISYPVPVIQDGEYELIVKMVFQKDVPRCFDLKINDVPISLELNLAKIVEKSDAVDLSFLFLVENSKTIMKIKGHSTPIPISKGFHLQICYGKVCKGIADKSFSISAFAVVRFGEDTIIPQIIQNINAESIVIGHPCQVHKGDANACQKSGCLFNLVKKQCVHTIQECPKDMFENAGKCQRSGAVYGNGGVNCISKKQFGVCVGQTVLAINLNGIEYYYPERQIQFKAEVDADFVDSASLRKTTVVNTENCKDAAKDEFFTNILQTGVTGNTDVAKEGCLSYPVPIKEDGDYEITIWAADGEHGTLNARCFDIQLNSVTIFSSVDPARLGGANCAKVETIILLKVTDGGKKALPSGFTEPIDIADGKLNLNACMGKCTYAKDVAFQISAFSIVKFGDALLTGDACEAHKSDVNACRMDGCEFDLVRKQCVHKMKKCPLEMFKDKNKCRRKDAVYAVGGVLCRNKMAGGVCFGKTIPTIVALNFNGKEFNFRSIKYKDEWLSDYEDPQQIHQIGSISRYCTGKKDKVFLNLLSGVMQLPTKTPAKGCVSFPFHIFEDGDYELSIFATEGPYTEPNKRHWDLKINSMTVLSAVDNIQIRGKNCVKNEIVVLFKVGNAVTALLPEGFTRPMSFDGDGQVQFCLASTKAEDSGFLISAFSIIKLKTALGMSGERVSIAHMVIRGDSSSEYYSSSSSSSQMDPCEMYGSDPKACRKHNCEFDLVRKLCVWKMRIVSTQMFATYGACFRAGAVYAFGGLLYRNQFGSKGNSCDGKVVQALNLNGEDHMYRKVKYAAELESDYKDPTKSRMGGKYDLFCRKDVVKDVVNYKNLMATAIFGDINIARKGCLTYPIKFENDGVYELSILGTEPFYKSAGQRCFDIMLNFLTVLYGVDHYAISGRACGPNEIVILFKVEGQGTQLTPVGFPTPIKIEGSVDFSVCFGSCGFNDVSYQLSAFSVILLNGESTSVVGDDCGVHSGRPCMCRKAGCEYNSADQVCVSAPTECAVPSSGCRRANAYYVTGGVLCKSTKKKGYCKVEQNILAVNMGGAKHTESSTNITFEAYADVPRDNTPEGVREGNVAEAKVPNPADLPLYQTFVAANKEVKASKDCLRYNIPINKLGQYELIIKFGDFEATSAAARTINIRFNGVKIVEELDMFKYTEDQFGVADLIVNFGVTDKGNILNIPGHGRSAIKGGKVSLEFCHGKCAPATVEFSDWHVSAWAVVKIPSFHIVTFTTKKIGAARRR